MKNLLAAVLFLLPVPLSAQQLWSSDYPGSSLSVEYLHPSFQKQVFGSYSGFVLLFSGRIAVAEDVHLSAEFPYVGTTVDMAYVNYLYDPSTGQYTFIQQRTKESRSTIGNLSVGVEFGSAESKGRFRVTIPTISEDQTGSAIAGLLGDLWNQERYAAKLLGIAGGYTYQPVFQNGLGVMFGISPFLWIPVGINEGGRDTEFSVDYAAGVGYRGEWLKVGLGLGGRMLLTEDEWINGKKALHFFKAESDFRIGILQPGISVRLPLDREVSNILGSTIAFRVQVLM